MKTHVHTSPENKSATADNKPEPRSAASAGQFKDNRAAALTQQKWQQAVQNCTSEIFQRIKIGNESVTTVTRLAERLEKPKNTVIAKFNEKLGNLPQVDEGKINNYLNYKKTKVSGGNLSDYDQYIGRLVESYKRSYMEREDNNFLTTMGTIESDQSYTTLVDPQGINYLDGEDDGASVGDNYDKNLACSLYAILALKPGFLGATTPKELHYILRLNPQTKSYDEDKEVAKIRLSAGLSYRAPGNAENTVSKFMNTLGEQHQGNKYIIDPSGAAHTFVLKYMGGRWKQVDNDHPDGVIPTAPNAAIRVIWN